LGDFNINSTKVTQICIRSLPPAVREKLFYYQIYTKFHHSTFCQYIQCTHKSTRVLDV